ncbi:MAG: hypothetical protein L0Y43_02470 [Methylococcaceae bacterium]|nr:hypothetical protein [Methylococcaceae bacterium]
MTVRFVILLCFTMAAAAFVAGCSSTRQIRIDHPSSESTGLESLPGFAGIDGDDYYIQWISDFDFSGSEALEESCGDIGPSYDRGAFLATLLFRMDNAALKFEREASGFLYQTSTGKCNFSFEARKVYLTPWMRLDSSRDTLINYSFLTSENTDVDLSRLAGDLNAASDLLALTGVGTGVAVIGKLASYWMLGSEKTAVPAGKQQPTATQAIINQVITEGQAAKILNEPAAGSPTAPTEESPQARDGASKTSEPRTEGQRRSELHSLPNGVSYSGKSGTLNEARFKVYEAIQGSLRFLDPDTRPLGTLRVYPEILPSLLLKIAPNGLPDASDLSLDELWRSKIKAGAADVNLRQIIASAGHDEKPNLEPDWRQYEALEIDCRKLKVVLKDLGFNKFDRNAILYYYLNHSPDWKNYNVAGQDGPPDEFRVSQVEKLRKKNFGNCLSREDYRTMKRMGLAVKTGEDWDAIAESGQKTIKLLGPLQSIERQLVPVIKNPNPEEMERQAFPLLATQSGGNGTVLLQNHLSNFGLEGILGVPAIPGTGVVINASQLSKVLSGLKIAELSCARPAMEQGRPLANLGILLFTTREGSPITTGGALEFEFNGGIISRLTFQHPTFRDFKQSLEDYPEIGGCRIDSALAGKLY